MQRFALPLFGFVFVAALSPFLLPAHHRVLGSTERIVKVHGGALDSYLPAAATLVQDVWPQVNQRGTQLDGMMRSHSAQGWGLNGNPFESAWRAPLIGGIRLDTGTYAEQDVDMALPATGFSWVIGRTHNGCQDSYRASN